MWWLVAAAAMAAVAPGHGEVFTAMTDMSRLLATEGEMIRAIENFIVAQEEKLEKLKRSVHNIHTSTLEPLIDTEWPG